MPPRPPRAQTCDAHAARTQHSACSVRSFVAAGSVPLPALPKGLMQRILRQFRLDPMGIHGAAHWARVMHHGLYIARSNGADPLVVRLFAVLHDSQRISEGRDPDHGRRASDYVAQLHEERVLDLDASQLRWLRLACEGHSRGDTEAEPTVAACWDADRLDLGRVDAWPNPRYLCTDVAMDPEYIRFAYEWARMASGKPNANVRSFR